MVDTKTPGDKTLSVPTKTLTLKPRVETGTVRQSFSHGRTKQVVVEKRGKRRVGGDAPATETHAPEPVVAKPPKPAARPRKNGTGWKRKPSARPKSRPRSDLARPRPRPRRRRRPPQRDLPPRPARRLEPVRLQQCRPRAPPALLPTVPMKTKVRARSAAGPAAPCAPSRPPRPPTSRHRKRNAAA